MEGSSVTGRSCFVQTTSHSFRVKLALTPLCAPFYSCADRSSLLEDSSDEDYDDDADLGELYAGSPEVQAITAVVDMLDGLGDEGIEQW